MRCLRRAELSRFIMSNKEDTYFQSRTDKQKDIYYTIYRWWDKLINGEVNFTDIDNGEGNVFVAVND